MYFVFNVKLLDLCFSQFVFRRFLVLAQNLDLKFCSFQKQRDGVLWNRIIRDTNYLITASFGSVYVLLLQ